MVNAVVDTAFARLHRLSGLAAPPGTFWNTTGPSSPAVMGTVYSPFQSLRQVGAGPVPGLRNHIETSGLPSAYMFLVVRVGVRS